MGGSCEGGNEPSGWLESSYTFRSKYRIITLSSSEGRKFLQSDLIANPVMREITQVSRKVLKSLWDIKFAIQQSLKSYNEIRKLIGAKFDKGNKL